MILVVRLGNVEAHYTHDLDGSHVDYYVMGGKHYDTFDEYLESPVGKDETVSTVQKYFDIVYYYVKEHLDIIRLALLRGVIRLECDIVNLPNMS